VIGKAGRRTAAKLQDCLAVGVGAAGRLVQQTRHLVKAKLNSP
jgi:hypothetical protein